MKDFCDDCGKEAVGRFDVIYYKVVDGIPDRETVVKTEKAKPLCATDAKSRGVK